VSIANLILNRSKERRALFSLFFSNETREYYLRELERITGISVGNIRRELNKFTEDRLFLTHRKGNLLFYKLNLKHPYYKELKKIIMSEVGIQADIQSILNKIKNIELAFIFGSFASRKASSDSDIDIMIIGNPDRETLTNKIAGLEKKFDREINYQVMKRSVYDKKKLDKNSFIFQIIEGQKIMLKGNENEL